MKTLFSIILVSLLSLSVAFPNEKGNHGDPFEVLAKPFPNEEQLTRVGNLVALRVGAAPYSAHLRDALQLELFGLLGNKRIRFLELDFLSPESAMASGFRFLGHGAWTLPELGASIYLTKRVIAKDDEQLGVVLLHEVLHHFFSRTLSNDELFIQDLAESIMSGIPREAVSRALDTGYFQFSEDAPLEQALDLWEANVPTQRWFCRTDAPLETELYEHVCERNTKALLIDLIERMIDRDDLCLNVENLAMVMSSVITGSQLLESDKARASSEEIETLLRSMPSFKAKLDQDCTL